MVLAEADPVLAGVLSIAHMAFDTLHLGWFIDGEDLLCLTAASSEPSASSRSFM